MARCFARPALAAAALALTAAHATAQPVLFDPALSLEPVAAGLSQPTGFTFAGSQQDLFAIEKATGRVRLVEPGGGLTIVLDLPVNSNSERGLLGIAASPDFDTSGEIFLYYSRTTTGSDSASFSNWAENRLSKFTWNGSQLTGEQVLFSIPADPAQPNGPNHDGGPLRFGPDGNLYLITGDLNRNRAEQNRLVAGQVLPAGSGGIVRLTPDGEIPADNPFADAGVPGFEPYFAYGIRNSFGLAFDPVTGNLWDTENGPASFDEINLVPEGFNSGWELIMGPADRSPNDPDDLVNLPGSVYSDPEFSWQQPIGVTALAFLAGSELGPAFDDAVLVGDNNTGGLFLFRLNDQRDGFVFDRESLQDLVASTFADRTSLELGDGFSVITDIQVGPDGGVYVMTLGDGAIRRLVPEPAAALTLLLGTPALLVRRR